MRQDTRDHDPVGHFMYLHVIDKDTGEYIHNCIAADDATGQVIMFHKGKYKSEIRNIEWMDEWL
jgi:hypothetical protein